MSVPFDIGFHFYTYWLSRYKMEGGGQWSLRLLVVFGLMICGDHCCKTRVWKSGFFLTSGLPISAVGSWGSSVLCTFALMEIYFSARDRWSVHSRECSSGELRSYLRLLEGPGRAQSRVRASGACACGVLLHTSPCAWPWGAVYLPSQAVMFIINGGFSKKVGFETN